MHNWDDLKIFAAVANSGSYSAAARKLNVNHATISRRIKAMEQEHGVRLFDRTQTGYQLTEAGNAIIDITESISDKTHEISRLLTGQDARLAGEIKLTMPHDIFDFMLVDSLKQFQLNHPDIDLLLLVSKGLRNMANREADLAVRITPSPPDFLIGKKICNLQHGIYSHINLDTSESIPLVLWHSDPKRPWWIELLQSKTHVALRVDDLFSMHQAVRSGIGVARMPCFLPDSIKQADVVRLPFNMPLSDWGVWILSHADLRNTARINACRHFISDELTQLIPRFLGEESNIKE